MYLQNVLALNTSAAGLLLVIISGMVVIIAAFEGWVTHRFGSSIGRLMVLVFTILSAVLHSLLTGHLQLALIIPAFMAFGMAWGFLNIAPVLAVTGIVEHKDTGVIIGLLWTFLNVGTSVGPAVMGMLFRSTAYFMPGFHLTMVWLIILSVIACI